MAGEAGGGGERRGKEGVKVGWGGILGGCGCSGGVGGGGEGGGGEQQDCRSYQRLQVVGKAACLQQGISPLSWVRRNLTAVGLSRPLVVESRRLGVHHQHC